MQNLEMKQLTERLDEIAEAFPNGKKISEAGARVWLDTLRNFSIDDVLFVLVDMPKRLPRQPTPHDVYKACSERKAAQIAATAEAQRTAQGFALDRLRGNSEIANIELAKIYAILKKPKPDGAHWIGQTFDRLAADEKAVCDHAVTLATEAEAIFAAKGRDVLAEYAATQQGGLEGK